MWRDIGHLPSLRNLMVPRQSRMVQFSVLLQEYFDAIDEYHEGKGVERYTTNIRWISVTLELWTKEK